MRERVIGNQLSKASMRRGLSNLGTATATSTKAKESVDVPVLTHSCFSGSGSNNNDAIHLKYGKIVMSIHSFDSLALVFERFRLARGRHSEEFMFARDA